MKNGEDEKKSYNEERENERIFQRKEKKVDMEMLLVLVFLIYPAGDNLWGVGSPAI